jgi:membrane protein
MRLPAMPALPVPPSLRGVWHLLRDTVQGFIDDDALSRGASIAYYTLFSLAPILLIVVALAGLAFGRDAARGALVDQLSGLMGGKSAEALQAMIESASDPKTGMTASLIGILAALITLTGAFGEVQSALNAIWKAKSRRSTLSRLMRARLASLGLVVTSGFLLTVSLVVSAALAALSNYLKAVFPAGEFALQVADIVISGTLLTGMFAAIYKVLPDTPIAWRDVAIGALVTTGLFEGGKYVIALYIGKSNVASSYGAAGALIVLLLWIFYSAQIFLLGAEFTRAFARRYGTHVGREISSPTPS